MKKFTIILLLLFACTSIGLPAFEDIGHDARARGMANAFYGEPGGISSIYYNPAGTSFTKSLEIAGNLGFPYAGLGTVSLSSFNGALLFPFTYHFKYDPVFKNSAIAFEVNNVSYFYEGSEYFDDDTIDYYERMITINLSKNFLDFLVENTRFGVGINFDILLRGFDSNIYSEKNSYFTDGTDTEGFGMDLGLLYFFNNNVGLGVVLDNLIEPDVAFNKKLSSETIPKNKKIGVSWKRKKLWKFEYTTIAGGVAFEDLKTESWEYRAGFEFWEFNRILGLRMGYEFSDEGMNNITSGLTGKKEFGKKHEIEVNYSFGFPLVAIKGTIGTHGFSMVYRYRFPEHSFEFDLRKRNSMIEDYGLGRSKEIQKPVPEITKPDKEEEVIEFEEEAEEEAEEEVIEEEVIEEEVIEEEIEGEIEEEIEGSD